MAKNKLKDKLQLLQALQQKHMFQCRKDRNVFIEHVLKDNKNRSVTQGQIHKYWQLWQPVKISVEDNYYQKALKQQLFLQGLPVVGITSTQSKRLRIESRSTDYENGRIRILQSQRELIAEHINYGDDDYKVDILDAIDMGCRGIPVRTLEQVVTGGVLS